jgi:non-specific serine/threonine protein kinase
MSRIGAPDDTLTDREVEILRLVETGMTDQEIGNKLFLTVGTIKWYNQRVYDKLGVRSRTQAIARARQRGLLDENSPTHPPVVLVHNLPAQTTHFVGRQHEIAQVKRLLETARLLTLTGPPGTGKTRLALRVTSEVLHDFVDGVYFVDLAPIKDPGLVANAIAAVLGVTESVSQPLTETLKRRLQHQRLLLLLDNFEHLLSAAPLVSELLASASKVKVLVTSREALHLYGEQEYFVPPLALPEPAFNASELALCESVALFVQQARAVKSAFELKEDNALDIAKICVRLEGLPLAIELSAARMKLLTPEALLARLSSRLDALTGGARDLPKRQQTLRNTIEWSYNLLDEGEKTLFARLAVFRGGRSLEAIESICGEGLPIDVFDGLASLVDKSLIQQKETTGGEPRFVMLETIHEYAWERLEASCEAETMRRRHAEHFVQLAERAEPELRLAQQQHWFHLLETEQENIRAVLEWSLGDGDITLGVRLAGALSLFWFACGYHVEGRQWAQQLLGRLDSVPKVYHIGLLFSAGHMAYLYDLEAAKHFLSRALDISRDLGDSINTAWSLIYLSYTMMKDTAEATAVAEEGLALFRELNHKPGIAQALNIIGELTSFSGEDHRARRAYEECLAVSQETGEKRRIRFMFGNLAFLAQHEGDYERARELAGQGLHLALEMNNRLDIADSLSCLAGAIGMAGQPERAARLLGAWEAALERLGAFPQPADRPEHDRNIAAVRAQLAPATFEAAWAEGRKMTLEQAVAYALDDPS